MTVAMSRARAPGRPARLRLTDLARLAVVGLRTRKLRAALSALGIAIGSSAVPVKVCRSCRSRRPR
jgi:putative ABC transport system permease protein